MRWWNEGDLRTDIRSRRGVTCSRTSLPIVGLDQVHRRRQFDAFVTIFNRLPVDYTYVSMNDEPPSDDCGPNNGGKYSMCPVSASESCSTAVVRCVATATDRDPLTMEPLAHSVDPGAIDSLFGGQSERTPNMLSFTFLGREILVTPGRVYVQRGE